MRTQLRRCAYTAAGTGSTHALSQGMTARLQRADIPRHHSGSSTCGQYCQLHRPSRMYTHPAAEQQAAPRLLLVRGALDTSSMAVRAAIIPCLAIRTATRRSQVSRRTIRRGGVRGALHSLHLYLCSQTCRLATRWVQQSPSLYAPEQHHRCSAAAGAW